MITPEPKYFVKKKAPAGMLSLLDVFAKMGKRAPGKIRISGPRENSQGGA